MTPGGLPHSGIRGSTPADGYPRLIAAFHALLRLVSPRHPPCALNSSAPRDAPCRANRIELDQSRITPGRRCEVYPYALVKVRGSLHHPVGCPYPRIPSYDEVLARGSSPRIDRHQST